jgi:permease yjgP/yjgQ family protein
MVRRTGLFYAPPPSLPDTVKTTATPTQITSVNQLLNLVDEQARMSLFENAINHNQSQMDNAQYRQEDVEYRYKLMNLHILNFSDKFALTVACFVLFFVAAPLGAFIRKGGIGLPLVVAMVLFLTYYFIGMFMKNIAENNTINPTLAPWIPAFILLPLGVYLTHRVNTDKEMFHFPLSHKLMRFIETKIANFKEKRQTHK